MRPRYLLEHALLGNKLAGLLSATRDCLHHHAIDSGGWGRRPLPLLIAATEVGYDYAGTVRDFSPIFARDTTVSGRPGHTALPKGPSLPRTLAVHPARDLPLPKVPEGAILAPS